MKAYDYSESKRRVHCAHGFSVVDIYAGDCKVRAVEGSIYCAEHRVEALVRVALVSKPEA